MSLRKALRYGIAAACIALFAVFVWPTKYRPIAISSSTPRVIAARENRFTGEVELLIAPSGWRRVPGVSAPTAKGDSLDPLAGYTPDWREKKQGR